MQHLPLILPITFILTTCLTLALLYRAATNGRKLLWLILAWLVLQGTLTLWGFYLNTAGIPPRLVFLLLPPMIMILIGIVFKPNSFDLKSLALLHVVRIPVELVLYGLYIYHTIPRLMTFEGGNLDILSGLSAPFIYYFGFVKQRIKTVWLIGWNVVCLLLLFNIVGRAILSAPFAFQQLAFHQPNVAILYFPYSWLPGFIVPAVLLAHLLTLRRLLSKPIAHTGAA